MEKRGEDGFPAGMEKRGGDRFPAGMEKGGFPTGMEKAGETQYAAFHSRRETVRITCAAIKGG